MVPVSLHDDPVSRGGGIRVQHADDRCSLGPMGGGSPGSFAEIKQAERVAVVMNSQWSWRKGWQLVCCTALPIAARMWVKNWRADVACELAQVLVVPGWFDACRRRACPGAVPADAKPVAVGGLGPEPRVQALVDSTSWSLCRARLSSGWGNRNSSRCRRGGSASVGSIDKN